MKEQSTEDEHFVSKPAEHPTSLHEIAGLPILIVEDSPTQALRLRHELEQAGCVVQAAEDGSEAIALLEAANDRGEQLPQAIISDVLMPRIDGFELCRRLKANPCWAQIPVMLLTTLGDPGDLIRGLESGADSFAVKPFEGTHLLTQLGRLVRAGSVAVKNMANSEGTGSPANFHYQNQSYQISAGVPQVLRFLVAAYEETRHRAGRLEQTNAELRLAHEEVASKNRELEGLNSTKNQLLGMAAHDLRNPLDVVRGYAEILAEEAVDRLEPDELRMLGVVRSSSDYMLALVNDLLDVTKIEAGTLSLDCHPVDAVEFVARNISLNRVFADRKNINLVLEAMPDLPFIIVDPLKADQVMSNLIGNALKYSLPGTQVTIEVKRGATEVASGDAGAAHGNSHTAIPDRRDSDSESGCHDLKTSGYVAISVRDQGQGIAAAELEHVFQPFHRAGAKSTGGETSAGLGLAIVRKIVECHHGTVSVESTVGVGSVFKVLFPAVGVTDSSHF